MSNNYLALGLFLIICNLNIGLTQWFPTYEAFKDENIDDLNGWVIQNQYEATFDVVTKCGPIQILGGLKSFGSQTTLTKMIKIPPHYRLKFIIQLWKIGDWENDKIQVFVDGVPWEMKWGFTEGSKQLCGGPKILNSDKVYDVEFEVTHNSPTANIVIASTQVQKADKQAWGMRNIKIYFKECPSQCGICHNDKVNECKFWKQVDLSWFRTDTSIEGWNLLEGKQKSFQCSGIVMFGGPNNVGSKAILSKTTINLPPHQRVMIKFTLWKFGQWDNDQFYVYIDDEQVYKQTFQKLDGLNVCGDFKPGYGQKLVNIEIIQKHKKNEMTVKFTSSLKQDIENQSWGIRDFFAFIAECPKFCKSCFGSGDNECLKCEETHQLIEGKCINKNDWFILSKEFNEPSSFKKITEWQIENIDPIQSQVETSPITFCGKDVNIFGGYKILAKKSKVQKLYTNIPAHNFLRLRITMYKIDRWDGEELIILGDNKQIWSQLLGWNDPGQSNICGDPKSPWKERIMFIDQVIQHNRDEFQLTITSTLQATADIASWGFRDVMLLYSPIKECITVFSECNYQGLQAQICDNVEELNKFDFHIKSMQIPEGLKFVGFKNTQFKGDRIEYTTNQKCLENIEFSFIQRL
ncbi:unnamed protein product [Paramecium sonneborni]|uniref:Uncharacterized protein n=1 Tax=Paramecium sonneborni TaxID=65129 RepID=A0A8S1KYV1_9CILI|nr:unnamed protein product [Paramecium sonneborni]